MGAGLVGDDVGLEVAGQQRGQGVDGVGAEADAERPALPLRVHAAADRVLEVVGFLVEVARLQPAGDPLAVDLDAERDAAVHRDRQRLRAAHPAEPGGDGDRPGQRAAVAPAGDLGEALVGPLHDALAADVDPGAGGHLPVHRQPLGFELAELVPVVPVADQVRVGDQDARRPLVGAHHADRLARLDEQRLVVLQRLQRADDRVVGLPGARRAAGAAVDDEVLGALGDGRVEVVHQHPHRGLLRPALAGQLRPVRRVDLAAHFRPPISGSFIRAPRSLLDRGDQRPGPDQLLGGGELRREPAVGAEAGDVGAQAVARGGGARRRARAARAGRARAPRR